MRIGTAILALLLAVSLGGCSLKKPKTVAAAPPPPKATAPAKPPAPLSIPQTTVELPPPQPVPPESLPPAEPGGQPAPPPPPPRTNTRPPRPAPAPARTEPQTPAGPPAPATPPPTETARPPILEVVPAAEAKRLQDEANGRIQETRQLMSRISPRRLRQQDSLHKRIETFLSQAEDAERRGDMRQASELAGRALVLARELRP